MYCILVYIGAKMIWKVLKTYVLGLPLLLVHGGRHLDLRWNLEAVNHVSSFIVCDQND